MESLSDVFRERVVVTAQESVAHLNRLAFPVRTEVRTEEQAEYWVISFSDKFGAISELAFNIGLLALVADDLLSSYGMSEITRGPTAL
jgi:hypothetical protein